MKIVSREDLSFYCFLTSPRFPTTWPPPRSVPVPPSRGGRPGCDKTRAPLPLPRGCYAHTVLVLAPGPLRSHVEGVV